MSDPKSPPTTLLELRSVTKTFARRESGSRRAAVLAVDRFSMTLERAAITSIVGESGAGKSTVARLVLGLERADSGSVMFDGLDMGTLTRGRLRAARRRMHLIFQDPYQSLHPGMRVGQLVAEPLAVARVGRQKARDRVLEALDEVGLTPPEDLVGRFPHELSGGQRQRVAIARAVVSRPQLMIADEPTSMLDASLCAGILELLLAIRDRYGTAFIYITHDLGVARYVSDHVVVMRRGRMIEEGSTDQVILNPSTAYGAQLVAASEGEVIEINDVATDDNHTGAETAAAVDDRRT